MSDYQVGDYLMHEGSGVCQVADISEKALQGKGSEKMYYSSDNIALEDGWTLEIKQESTQVYVIEVTDKDGNLNATYEVFAASL